MSEPQEKEPPIDRGIQETLEALATDPKIPHNIGDAAQALLDELPKMTAANKDQLERLDPDKLLALLAAIAEKRKAKPPTEAEAQPEPEPTPEPQPAQTSEPEKPKGPNLYGYAAATALIPSHPNAVHLCFAINTGMLDRVAADVIAGTHYDRMAELLPTLPDNASGIRVFLNEKFPTPIKDPFEFEEF